MDASASTTDPWIAPAQVSSQSSSSRSLRAFSYQAQVPAPAIHLPRCTRYRIARRDAANDRSPVGCALEYPEPRPRDLRPRTPRRAPRFQRSRYTIPFCACRPLCDRHLAADTKELCTRPRLITFEQQNRHDVWVDHAVRHHTGDRIRNYRVLTRRSSGLSGQLRLVREFSRASVRPSIRRLLESATPSSIMQVRQRMLDLFHSWACH